MNFKENEINSKLLDICVEGTELYLVGGYIRDVLLCKECFDLDYCVKGESAIDFARKAADALEGYFVLLDEKHDIARVVLQDKITVLDFAGCVGGDIFADLKNRDYTINAIAFSLVPSPHSTPNIADNFKSFLIDPLNGIEDLKNKTIRAVSEENIMDDPLRILRAYRFAAQLNFSIEEKTFKFIKKHKLLINNVSVERITQELIKLFESEHAGEQLYVMKEARFLDEILPELTPQRQVPPNLHHHLGLLDHSIESVIQLEKEIKKFPDWSKEHFNREFSQGIKAISLMKLAMLLHDLGKPSTWNIDEEGRHRFIKHEEIGSEMVFEVLKRLKFSKNSMKYISKLIKYHMYPSQLLNDGIEYLTEKAMMRMFRRIGNDMPELLLISMSDRLSAKGVEITDEIISNNVNGLYFLLEQYKKTQEEVKTLPKFADGRDVMEIRKLSAGPQIGKILNELKEAQISGDISTREQALEFIKTFEL